MVFNSSLLSINMMDLTAKHVLHFGMTFPV